MSLASACWITLARTLVVVFVAWPVCEVLDRWFRGLSESRRAVALVGLLAPFCFPEMLVGYAYRDMAMTHPAWAEELCGLLLWVRVIPVGTVALMAAPAPDRDAAAIHCRRLLLAGTTCHLRWLELARCYWRGPVSRALPALGLMALIAMQEFELAALLMATSWTDWFIMAQRLGLEQHAMLWQALKPLALQLPLLIGIVVWMSRVSQPAECATSDGEAALPERSAGASRFVLAVALVGITLLVGVLVPLGLMGWRTVEGLRLLLRQRTQLFGLLNEMAVASMISFCAGLAAWWIASLATRPRGKSGLALASSLLLLPGLFGSLLVSLTLVAAFQQPWLRPLYDTPLPWGCALIVWLLPRAAVLQLWLDAFRPAEALHVVELAMSHEQQTVREVGQTSSRLAQHSAVAAQRSSLLTLLWRLRDEPRWLAIGLLCYWAYCDLPTAYLLAPTRMAPGLVRLYNFMHFGRSAALSSEAILFFGLPLLGVGVMVMMARWCCAWAHRR